MFCTPPPPLTYDIMRDIIVQHYKSFSSPPPILERERELKKKVAKNR